MAALKAAQQEALRPAAAQRQAAGRPAVEQPEARAVPQVASAACLRWAAACRPGRQSRLLSERPGLSVPPELWPLA